MRRITEIKRGQLERFSTETLIRYLAACVRRAPMANQRFLPIVFVIVGVQRQAK